ncbi:MAG: type pilus assembly protein PilN [Actinomycetota bacterium]|jgi:Tfp pilus assembly protein PilN|nr:type pilus assembly protein PilN [Actinomycetota bacterium]
MSLMTETGSAITLDSLPRVNLLPPEIAETRRVRRIQIGLGGAVLGAVGVVALLYVAASSSVSSAQTDVDAATATNTHLQAETAKYRDVTAAYDRAAAAQAMLTQAMGEEVRYSRLLTDLSLSVPENVWIKSLTFSQAPAPAALGSTVSGIGTMTVSGIGFKHDDVAVWLESLAGQKSYTNPYFTSSTEALLGTRKTVTFSSTATLTPAAYSGRYTKPAGG